MIKLVIANQKGGVSKTTTSLSLARCFAERGLKVLLIDTDSQGSIATALGLKVTSSLYHFLISNYRFKDCVISAHPLIDVLCSTRDTIEAEGILTPRPGRELIFQVLLSPVEHLYDVIMIDVAPSITLLQSCAMMYAQQILIPLSMDPLSLQGAFAALQTSKSLNQLFKANIKPAAILPVMVDRRLQMTDLIFESIQVIAQDYGIPILPSIRTDAAVTKSTRAKTFLMDFDPKCKAVEDYQNAADKLLEHLRPQLAERHRQPLPAEERAVEAAADSAATAPAESVKEGSHGELTLETQA
jgi:chromosome partitioning protein